MTLNSSTLTPTLDRLTKLAGFAQSVLDTARELGLAVAKAKRRKPKVRRKRKAAKAKAAPAPSAKPRRSKRYPVDTATDTE